VVSSSYGAILVVSLKGKQARLKDVEVMAAGKEVGLVDNKVVGFSETHTALKIEEQLRPMLYRDGAWIADYKRLRVVAVREDVTS